MRKMVTIILCMLSGVFLLFLSACEETETLTPNHPPEIQSFGLVGDGLEAGKVGTLVCIAKDPDGDSLTYTWTASEGELFGDGDTVFWRAPNEASQYPIYCIVNDGLDEQKINFTVQVFPNMLFSEHVWTVYNESNTGLPNYTLDEVWSIAVDDLGRVWAGLDVGYFYMFDGTEWQGWKCFNDAGEVLSVDLDSKNNAWITGGHLAKWDGGTIKEYFRRCPTNRTCKFPSGVVVDVYDNIWVGFYDHSGPSVFDGVNWIDFDTLGLPPVDDIAIDNNGDIWYTADSFLVHYDHQNWAIFDGPNPAWLNSIAIDRDDHIWVATESDELALFDHNDWTFFSVPFTSGYITINDILIDDELNIWCAFDHGIAILDGKIAKTTGTGVWHTILTNENSPIPSGWVNSLTFDSDGNLWGGTHSYGANGPGGGGLFKINLSGE